MKIYRLVWVSGDDHYGRYFASLASAQRGAEETGGEGIEWHKYQDLQEWTGQDIDGDMWSITEHDLLD